METIPASVAEQLAVVAAFIIFLVGVWGFLKWILNWTKSITTEQRAEWQAFMAKENDKTRVWLDTMESGNRKTICQMTEALEAVNDNLRALADQLTRHDEAVPTIVNKAIEEVKKINVPVTRKRGGA